MPTPALATSASQLKIAAMHRYLYRKLPALHRLVHFSWTLPSALKGLYMLRVRDTATPLRIVIGATGQAQKSWIPTEVYTLNLLNERHWQRYFHPDSIETILAEHVWEHLDDQTARQAAATCFTYLQPGGRLRVAVPDGCHPDAAYREFVRPGGSGPGANDHKQLFTHESLAAVFSENGFQVRLLEYFDEAGSFHKTDWQAEDGYIGRSSGNDRRNHNGQLVYTSIILDAIKPKAG